MYSCFISPWSGVSKAILEAAGQAVEQACRNLGKKTLHFMTLLSKDDPNLSVTIFIVDTR